MTYTFAVFFIHLSSFFILMIDFMLFFFNSMIMHDAFLFKIVTIFNEVVV